ncbi:uncharacterized protein LOC128205101 [Mya arenaria]|uniref:uncharacterized protein LOC128205101 n=1 Tax=Mya arenaria TaxID=6604 RepID=UPI0022DFEBD1|nr:uncharacterized protein LOC128205101 [Mya arenaria]
MELLIHAWSVFYCVNAVISSDIVSFEANTTLVEDGSAVLLKCLSNNQTLDVNFFKDNIYVGSCGIFDCQVINTAEYITSQNTSSEDYNEHYLTIKHFSKSLAGTYSCISLKTRDSEMVNLTFAAFIKFANLNPTNDPVSVIENTSHQFECETSIGIPYATVKWFKDNRTIDDIADDIDLTHLSTSRHENEVTRSVLQFQPTKADHGMRLFCLANNGGPDIYSIKPVLDVLYGPSIPKCQFNSSVVNENISIRKGQDLTISCSADGNPPPFLMWTYPTGSYSGHILSLSKIATDASGNFTCSARNTLKPTDGQEVIGSTSSTFAVKVYVPIADVFISSPTKDVVVLQNNEELIVKCECLDGIPKATFKWFIDNATNGNKTDDKLITNDNDVSVQHQFQNGTTVSYLSYTAKSSESGMRIYCVAQNVINELTASNSLLLAIIGIPDTPYNLQVKDVKTDAATLKWNQLYTGGLEFSVAIELRENTNEWKTHEVSEFIINDTEMRAALNNLNASTSYVLRFMVFNVLGRSMISDEMQFQTLKQNDLSEKCTVSSSVSAALFGGIFGALVLGVALGCGYTCLVVKCRRGRAPEQVLEMPTAQVKRDQESNVGDPTMYENSATTRAENVSPYAELDVHTIATSTSYEMIKHTMFDYHRYRDYRVCVQGHRDLDLLPDGPEINEGHLQDRPNLKFKSEGQCILDINSYLQTYGFNLVKISFNMELLIHAWSVFYCINAVISSDIVSFEANTTLVEDGSAVLLKCLSNNQTLDVNFFKDNIYVGSCGIFDCQVINTAEYITSQNTSSEDYNEHYLTIKHFSKSLAGTYSCISLKTRDSEMVNLTFAAFIKFANLNPTNDPVSVIENTSHQFECETSIGIPYATVKWFKDNRTIDDIADDIDLTHLSTSRHENEVTRSVLQFQPTKADHGMRLFCLANNGGPDIYSIKPVLDVLYGPSIPKCQFNSSVVNENISIRKGQDLTISCSADGNPPPFLMWTYPTGSYSGHILSLSKIATDASGNFTCSARNTLKPTDGQEVIGSTSSTFAVKVYVPIADVFISSPTKDVVVLQNNEELIVKCECLDGIPKATFKWFIDNATNGNKTDDKLITNDNDVSVQHQFQNGTTVSYLSYTAKSSESGMRIYCVAQNVINELTASNSLLLAIIGIPDTPYNLQVKDVKTDAATLKWNQLYTGGLEFSVAIELRENTNEWKTHEVSEFIINDTEMRAALNNLNASTSYVLRFMVFNVLGRSMISDEMQFQTLKQNDLSEKCTVSSSVSAALFGGIFGALVLGVALGCGYTCLVVKCRRGRAPEQVLEMPTAQVKRDQESNVGDPTMYENSATTRAENVSPYAELDVHTIATSTSYEMIKHTM